MAVTYYYEVTLDKSFVPNQINDERVGCYLDLETTEKVVQLVYAVFFPEKPFMLYAKRRVGDFIQKSPHWILNEERGGCLTIVAHKLNYVEMRSIFETVPKLLGIDPFDKEIPQIVDIPKSIVQRSYYCIILDLCGVQGPHRHILGYYQTQQEVDKVFKVAKLIEEIEKYGLNLTVESSSGTFVQYHSGKLRIQVGEESHELKHRCNRDIPKLTQLIHTAIGWLINYK